MICRLCLSCEGPMNSIMDIRLQLFSKIQSIAPRIRVTMSDGFSSTVCVSCTERVQSFYLFQKLIERSNETLKEWDGNKSSTFTMKPSQQALDKTVQENQHVSITQKDYPDVKQHEELAPRVIDISEDNKSKLFCCLLCLKCFCDDNATTYSTLICHSKLHLPKGKLQNIPAFKCEICSESFTSKLKLITHQRAHLKIKPFQCDMCKRKFGSASLLDVHLKNNECRSDLLCCEHCGSLHKSRCDLKKHKSSTCPANSGIDCNLCNKRLSNIQTYRVHMKYHLRGRQFSCSSCKNSYFTLSQLKQHQMTHTDSYPCMVCRKVCSSKHDLARHMIYHNKIKKHVCALCKSSFYERHHLAEHIRLKHSSEKTYACEKCGKMFSSIQSLKKHIKNHPVILLDTEDQTNIDCTILNTSSMPLDSIGVVSFNSSEAQISEAQMRNVEILCPNDLSDLSKCDPNVIQENFIPTYATEIIDSDNFNLFQTNNSANFCLESVPVYVLTSEDMLPLCN